MPVQLSYQNTEKTLLDKALVRGEDYVLTETGDFQTVWDEMSTLQAAQIRCLAHKGTWFYDRNLGSEIHTLLTFASPYSVKDQEMLNYVQEALDPMLLDGRLTEINFVRIIQRFDDAIVVEIDLTVGVQKGTIRYLLPV